MKKLSILLISIFTIISLVACGSEDTNANQTIKVYTRDTSSGTRDGFMGAIGFKEAKKDDSVLVDGFIIAGNSEIINAVKNDVYAIGYISLSSLTADIKGLNYNGVEPSEANVNNGTYKLSRNFNYMLRDDMFDENGIIKSDLSESDLRIAQITEAFIAYIKTIDGKATISTKGGIVDLTTGDMWANIKENFPVCELDNSSVTVKFGGSDSVEKVATGLTTDFSAKCGNFVPDHNHTGSSNAYKGLNGANNNASDNLSIHIGFASREFNDEESANVTGKLATDAIVVVVNKENNVSNITGEILKNIYSGSISDWNELK